ncbi:uncharacterized protein LOC130664281 [Microplitis mediator]|uniref:uncharacterized protein LOC130664281 n=1 Tax=Microplitis mediator TaxID=375433 RepID=UPI002557AF1A|nr:uncharacterized protein LOC130664281 [Microplitis mediator]
MRKTLVNALILPHIDYCSALNGIGTVLDKALQRLVNKGVRYILGLPWDSPISQARNELGWLTTSKVRARVLIMIVRKALIERTPSYLADLIAVYTAARNLRSLSSSTTLVIPQHRIEACKASFAVAAPYVWNDLPESIRSIRCTTTFKQELHK